MFRMSVNRPPSRLTATCPSSIKEATKRQINHIEHLLIFHQLDRLSYYKHESNI